jgi:hypothetical protein
MTTIEADLTTKALAGLTIRVMNAQIIPITITVGITIKYGYTNSSVYAAIQAALDLYLDPDYWDWSSTIYKNELISLIDQVEGVDRVNSVVLTESTDLATIDGNGNAVLTYQGLLPQHVTTIGIS